MKPTQGQCYLLISVLIVTLTCSLVACTAADAEIVTMPTSIPQTTLTVSGSGTATLILSGVQSAFEADVPTYRLDILPGSGTGGGVSGLVQGLLDAAAMARPPKDEEADQGVEYVEFGQSGVAVYTHIDVGITNLTTEQVIALFSGQTTNWSQVGGPDIPIVLYVRDEGDSSTKALREQVLGDTPFPEIAIVLTSQSDMQAAIAGTPGGVGIGAWPAALAAGSNVRPIALDGIAPGDSTYPMVSPVGIGYLSADEANVQSLIDWLLSEQGQAALSEFDVIIAAQ